MDPLTAAKLKAQKTYNLAADYFDAEPLSFWDRYGRGTIVRLNLKPGMNVLDVCCGTGASALPVAAAVGPTGKVIAVDLADSLLELGRVKAEKASLDNVEFRHGDMTAVEFPDDSFDAVVCVFGIFFVPDMETQTAELWRMVKPGGKLAITTWGPNFFAPVYEVWQSEIQRVRPDLFSSFSPWDRITTPDAVAKLFADAGIPDAQIEPEQGHVSLSTPQDFWIAAMGSGLRWTIDQMGEATAADVRARILKWIDQYGIDRIATNVIYGVAQKSD